MHGVPQDAIMMINLNHKTVLILSVSVDIHRNGEQGVCAVGFDHGLPCRVKNMARGTQ